MSQPEIIQAIAEHLGLSPEDIDKTASLRQDLNLGPLELNDLLSDLSKRFNIAFDSEDIKELDTVNDLIILVEDNMID
ncbi:MAG: acyl carrier protein [Candidatus Daviesbacteria bacterium]|nr:MAG: acyl carrier protein [Candidatus Daviesbacteria bacterium]